MIETTMLEELLSAVWKPFLFLAAIFAAAIYAHHTGFVAGKAEVQTKWDAESLLMARAAATQQAHNISIEAESTKGLQDENKQLKDSLASVQDYYEHHPVRLPSRVRVGTTSKSDHSAVPFVPETAGQPETRNTNDVSDTGYVSKEDFNQLADDCLATTEMLVNAQHWGAEQTNIFKVK